MRAAISPGKAACTKAIAFGLGLFKTTKPFGTIVQYQRGRKEVAAHGVLKSIPKTMRRRKRSGVLRQISKVTAV